MDTQQFQSFINSLLPQPPASLAVAVSGGADSMALALLLKDWCAEHKVKLTALTVDHGLRKESAKEAKQVHAWMAAEGIEHYVLTATSTPSLRGSTRGESRAVGGKALVMPPHDSSIANARSHLLPRKEGAKSISMEHARELRYGLLLGWCKKHKVKHLAVAHHRDDQAETFLMRLSRGSGVDGLSCMTRVSEMDGVTLLRPLLDVPKAELVAYLKQQKIAYVDDPTNRRREYTRNRVRQALEECFSMEERALLDQRLGQTAATMQRVKEALECYTEQAMEECTKYRSDICHLSTDIWRSYPPEIRLRVLTSVLQTVGRADKPLRFEKLDRLHNSLLYNDKISITLAGCKVEANGKTCLIRPENTRRKS